MKCHPGANTSQPLQVEFLEATDVLSPTARLHARYLAIYFKPAPKSLPSFILTAERYSQYFSVQEDAV